MEISSATPRIPKTDPSLKWTEPDLGLRRNGPLHILRADPAHYHQCNNADHDLLQADTGAHPQVIAPKMELILRNPGIGIGIDIAMSSDSDLDSDCVERGKQAESATTLISLPGEIP